MTWALSEPLLYADDAFEDIQRAVCATVAGEVAPVVVYDFAPETADLPYVLFNIGWSAERDTLNGTASRLWWQIDVWSDYRGYLEAIQIARKITRRLGHSVLYLDGYSPIHILREQVHMTRDPDGKHRRVALTFNSPYVSPIGG